MLPLLMYRLYYMLLISSFLQFCNEETGLNRYSYTLQSDLHINTTHEQT